MSIHVTADGTTLARAMDFGPRATVHERDKIDRRGNHDGVAEIAELFNSLNMSDQLSSNGTNLIVPSLGMKSSGELHNGPRSPPYAIVGLPSPVSDGSEFTWKQDYEVTGLAPFEWISIGRYNSGYTRILVETDASHQVVAQIQNVTFEQTAPNRVEMDFASSPDMTQLWNAHFEFPLAKSSVGVGAPALPLWMCLAALVLGQAIVRRSNRK